MDLLNYYMQRKEVASEKMVDIVKNVNVAVNEIADYINSQSHTPDNVMSNTELLRNNLSLYIEDFKSVKSECETLEGVCLIIKNKNDL